MKRFNWLVVLFLLILVFPKIALAAGSDVNNDGVVNGADLIRILQNFSLTGNRQEDVNQDQKVNLVDAGYILKAWGQTAASPSPQPSPQASSPAQSSEWTQFAHDERRTSYNPQQLSSSWSSKWIWNSNAGDGRCEYAYIDSSTCRTRDDYRSGNHTCLSQSVEPITGNNRVYIGTLEKGVISLDQQTGQELWRFNTGKIEHTGAYDAETKSVYFVGNSEGNGILYKINSETGAGQERRLSGYVAAAPLLVRDKIYIGTQSGNFYSIDKKNLNINRQVNLGGSAINTPAAYSWGRSYVIVAVDDMRIYALDPETLEEKWRSAVLNGNTFCHSYPVVSDIHGIVFITSHLGTGSQACDLIWHAAPSNEVDTTTVSQIRTWINQNSQYKSYFALRLSDGGEAYTVPILYAGHELHFENTGCNDRDVLPPPVLRTISSSEEAAYVVWRTKQACSWDDGTGACDARSDGTLGEMNIATGNIRFLRVDDNANRVITDEFDFMSMSGDVLFHNNWQSLGAQKIDRSSNGGDTFNNPIPSQAVYALLHSVWNQESCSSNTNHYCSGGACAPSDCSNCDSKRCYGKSFFIYTAPKYTAMPQEMNRNIHSPISNGVVYQRTFDGTIMAVGE